MIEIQPQHVRSNLPARIGGAVTACAVALPDHIVTNFDLESRLETSDQWIRERTGIRERRVGKSTSELAAEAVRGALSAAGPGQVDCLLLATSTPDQLVPATASKVQHLTGLDCGAFDLHAGCSGFVYGLVVAHGMLAAGARRIVLVGAETLSAITDPTDRTLAVLVGDGAGAVVIDGRTERGGILAWDLGSDGGAGDLLFADHGGQLHMNGREIFRRAVRIIEQSCLTVMHAAGVSTADIDLFVPHQANARIIEAAGERLGMPPSRVALVIEDTGNTSAASIPIALHRARSRLRDGDLVLMTGFGAGMTWATVLMRWATSTS